MARNRVRPLLLLLLLLLLPTCELKSRQKKKFSLALSFSKISLTRATNNFFFSLFSFSQGKIKKFCLKTHTHTHARKTHALLVCARRLLHTRYRKRETTLAWIRRQNENGLQNTSRSSTNSKSG
jgi:hypothetical protein